MIYVHQLGVDASFRRRGIGRALLEAVEDEAIAWGADQVALDTWSFNAAARAFFTACGYEVYNERLRRRFSHEPERMLRPMRPSGATMAASLPQRRFGWLDMWVPEGEDPRADGGWENSEKGVLLGQLTDRRLTLEMKCAGLDAAQMATPSVPPSDLTLLGLVRHLASVEHYWVRTIIQCREQPGLFVDPAGNDAAFTVRADAAMVDHAWRAWEAEVENTDRVLARIGDLGEPAGGRPMPIREVIVHLIREYTQHLGHADLLRERIDGRVGQ